MTLLRHAALALAAAGLATAHNASVTVCNALQARFPGQVASSVVSLNTTLTYDYQQATQRYYSAACAQIPACVFLPVQASDVAGAVQELNRQPSVPWAVKGGGHNSNVGWSGTAGGVLIAMETMADTVLDSQNLAHVGAGARWGDVMSALEPAGRAVVGGRLGDVGVGGYTLGGGLSFLSAEYGLAADSVVEFEVVTADGQVRTVNNSTNTDLFRALKGGGNQFAIVTTFIFYTYPIGQIWGGVRTYTLDQKDTLIAAVHNLTSDYSDPKAAVIVTIESTLEAAGSFVLIFYFYDGPSPGAILDNFLAIPYLTDTCFAQSYASLLNANSAYSLYGMRYQLRGATIPNLPGAAGIDLYSHVWDSFLNVSANSEHATLDNFVFSTAYQPMPHQIAQASQNAPGAGNVLGLDPAAGDIMWMEYDTSWLLPTTDSAAHTFVDWLTSPVYDYARATYPGVAPTHYQSGDIDFISYNPQFMNDAMYDQDVLHSYGANNYAMLKATQLKWDPHGFFSKRTGGYKYT